MLTRRQITEHALLQRVTESFEDMPADQIWFALMRKYAPDVLIELYWPEQFRNPIVTSRFPGIRLYEALTDVARFCGVTMSITDHGAIKLERPQHTERMKHGIVLEPDPHTWQPVDIVQRIGE